MKNLVVLDDSLTIHKIVEYSIDPDKYKLYKIFTLEDFNSKLKDIDVHLLLLDNKLDGLNVKDFCKGLKENNKNIKIILLVGAFERLGPQDITTLNIDDFINKPFNSKVLSEKIETLMGGVPSYVERGFKASQDKVREIDYEKLLEELEPIASKGNINNDGNIENKELEDLSFNEEELDVVEKEEDIKAMRASFKSIEDVEDLKFALERKLKKDLENIDFSQCGAPIIEEYIKQNLERINLGEYVIPFIEKGLNEILPKKIEETLKDIINQIVKVLVPDIAEKLVREEIENIKKGGNE
jgi:DNA-binding response OmpR family regulator